MSKTEKLYEKIMLGRSDANVGFDELRTLLARLGFEERVKGSHHIFVRDDVDEIVNIQPVGADAKAYQVKQVRNIILKYRLGISNE